MSSKKKPDKLTRDAMECKRLGYGCHYGDYIAARDNRTVDFLRREAAAPETVEPEPEREVNGPVVIVQEGKKAVRYCQICGKPLGKNAKKYCKGECQQVAYDRYHHINVRGALNG